MTRETIPFQKHSETSRAAARDIREKAPTLLARVYRFLKDARIGATDEEMQMALGMNPNTQRPRRVELVKRELVVNSGRTRLTTSGRKATVWIHKDHVKESA